MRYRKSSYPDNFGELEHEIVQLAGVPGYVEQTHLSKYYLKSGVQAFRRGGCTCCVAVQGSAVGGREQETVAEERRLLANTVTTVSTSELPGL